jgi:membrane dipeptidase
MQRSPRARLRTRQQRRWQANQASALLGLLLSVLAAVPAVRAAESSDIEARVDRVLARTPLIDGHNDLAWEIRERFKSDLARVDLQGNTAAITPPPGAVALMTDIPRLRAGRVGAQFWSVWIPTQTKGFEAVQTTIEQIDLVKAMVQRYPTDLEMAYTAADIRRVHRAGKIASLIGIEGGHQINNSLPVLRQLYALGARYMTLTHTSNTDWADSANRCTAPSWPHRLRDRDSQRDESHGHDG